MWKQFIFPPFLIEEAEQKVGPNSPTGRATTFLCTLSAWARLPAYAGETKVRLWQRYEPLFRLPYLFLNKAKELLATSASFLVTGEVVQRPKSQHAGAFPKLMRIQV